MSICSCPLATALPTIPSVSCASDFGQIQKIAFQRIHSKDATLNSFVSGDSTSITKKAAWQKLIAAEDGTKIAVTPYVEAPTADGGDAITFGGGNETLGGVTRNIGRNPVSMSFALRQFPQEVIKALKQLQCENDLGVYFFNGDGQILAKQDETTETTYYPIPIQSLFVGDLLLNGLETPDANTLTFSLAPNYSDNVAIVTPEDFNPLTDL